MSKLQLGAYIEPKSEATQAIGENVVTFYLTDIQLENLRERVEILSFSTSNDGLDLPALGCKAPKTVLAD